jgi:glycerophosphoryl diester phosphodiesterase
MAEVRRQGMAARTTVQSFAPGIVAAAVRSAPEIPVWIVASTADAARVDLGLDAGATGVNVRYDHISTDTVASLKAQGLAVSSWTPNDPGIWAMLVAAGVDVIVTDRPAQLVQTLTPAPRDFDGPENGRALVE